MSNADSIKWFARLSVEKFDADATAEAVERSGIMAPNGADFERLGIAPSEVVVCEENLITTAGLGRITSLILGGGGQAATATAARIGAGDGAGTAAVGDADLSASAGSTHRWFQIMDSTYPQSSAGVMTFKATFATGDGNFAWNEWGIDIGTPTVSSGNTVSAVLLNHKTSAALGTKTSSGTWVATATITLS